MKDFVPDEYFLSQNYPDPFKEKTTIKYCLPENVKVKLELFDSKKNKIKTLVDETKEAGTYQVEIDGKELQMGYYYYKMQAGSYEKTKKIRIER
ncbi:MAG: T9SS type A sorting domain-containing protein [Ignavibacteriaceae bacterium]|nr:T9SS type A sorting domain-containing protein [Ignavibacteriaceae bacterium]